MFRFFRILRRKLLDEDKIRTYLWYALGEIFLVVIGILIALQINNWNEERKKEVLKDALLENIRNDLKNDLEQLIFVRDDVIAKDELGMYLMSYFNSELDVSEFDVHKLRRGFMDAIDIFEFTPVELGYRELLSSGLVNSIEDDSLKLLLVDHYETSKREGFDFRQRERYDVSVADGRFKYIPNLALREKVKSVTQQGDWKVNPYGDFNLNWEKIRSDGEFPMYLGRLLALHLAVISDLDYKEENIHTMIERISAEIEGD